MAGWRYFATRLHGDGTETLIDPDLPLQGASIDDLLSGAPAITGTIEPTYPRLLDSSGERLLREWSTAIYAEQDGIIRCGGIVVAALPNGSVLEIETTGFTGYPRDMPYVGNGYKGVKVDPIDVFRVIWGHLQGEPGGDLGLTFDGTTTGGEVIIGTELKQVEFDSKSGPVSFESGPYKLNWYTNHDLAADIDELASSTPFDWHERHFWAPDGTLRHHVDIGYPKLGRRREDLRFTYGVNVFEPPAPAGQGENYASGTMVLGAGEGASMIRSLREPVVPAADRRLRRIATVVDDTIKSRKAADRRADQENQWRARLDDLDAITVMDHPDATFGSVEVGDEIRVESRGDWGAVDVWVRVLGINYSPDDGGTATYTVTRPDKLTS